MAKLTKVSVTPHGQLTNRATL